VRAQGPAASSPLPSWTAKLPESSGLIPAAPRDSLARRVGYQHWKGAAIGASLGAFAGFMLTLIYDNDCADCDKPSYPLVKGALGGAAIGGLIGFVAGLASPRYAPETVPAGS